MRERLGNVAEEDLAECGSRLQKYYLNTVTSVVSLGSDSKCPGEATNTCPGELHDY